MAEGESGSSHTVHKEKLASATISERSYTAYQHQMNESKSITVASDNNTDESEPNTSGAIPKICHQQCVTFHCTLCNVHYNRRLEYVLHVRQSHTSNEKFKCDLCVKVCPNYPALMRHKIMAHTSTRYT